MMLSSKFEPGSTERTTASGVFEKQNENAVKAVSVLLKETSPSSYSAKIISGGTTTEAVAEERMIKKSL